MLINKIEKGTSVTITLPSAPGQQFSGKVNQVAFAAGNAPTYPVIIEIEESLNQIRPGMAANVSFILQKNTNHQSNKMVAPVAAVIKENEENFVYVLTKHKDNIHQATKRAVSIGKLFPEGFEVLSGLEENELVATAGLKSLMDGMEVKLFEE